MVRSIGLTSNVRRENITSHSRTSGCWYTHVGPIIPKTWTKLWQSEPKLFTMDRGLSACWLSPVNIGWLSGISSMIARFLMVLYVKGWVGYVRGGHIRAHTLDNVFVGMLGTDSWPYFDANRCNACSPENSKVGGIEEGLDMFVGASCWGDGVIVLGSSMVYFFFLYVECSECSNSWIGRGCSLEE